MNGVQKIFVFGILIGPLTFIESGRWGGGGGGWSGGGGGGNRWQHGGFNNWRQQQISSSRNNFNYGHNQDNNHETDVADYDQQETNYHNNNHNSYNQWTNTNNHPNPKPNNPKPEPSEGPLVSFSNRPSQSKCAVPSMGDSSKFELRCISPNSEQDVECSTVGNLLTSGTTAILRCRSPYFNEDGEMRIWVCEGGTWKGEFKAFRCSIIINDTSSHGNGNNKNPWNGQPNNSHQVPTWNNSANYQKPGWNWQSTNNGHGQTNNNNNNGNNQKPTWNQHSSSNNSDKFGWNGHTTNSNLQPNYPWNVPTKNGSTDHPKPAPVQPKPNKVVDSLFPGVIDEDQSDDDYVESFAGWKPKPDTGVATPLAPATAPPKQVTQPVTPSWEELLEQWAKTSTTPPTTTTTTTTQKPQKQNPPDWTSQNYTEKTTKCPFLSNRIGVQLECLSKTPVPWDPSSFLVSQTDCKAPQVVGTEATYKCQQYFEASAGLTIQYRKCKDDGTWTGGENGFSCSLECGRANPVGKIPLITHGEPTYKAQWPWHAALFFRDMRVDPTQHAYICGATLISRRAILTAAHCVTEYFSKSLKSMSEFRIDLGRYERAVDDEFVQTFTAETIIPHPSYNPYIYDSDIAIIILKTSVTVGFHVRPICYPQQQNTAFEDLHLSDGSVGTVVGFGKNENDQIADILQMAKLKVINQQECAESFSDTTSGAALTKSTTFCAGLKNGTNVCSGDSGGGIYFPINQGGGASRWYLQGLVSVGITRDGEKRCDPTRYSIFTRISPYADWIVRVLSESDALL